MSFNRPPPAVEEMTRSCGKYGAMRVEAEIVDQPRAEQAAPANSG
jgi:hypothetical protein